MFYGPNTEDVIGPIEDLIDDEHPPVYRSYRYAEFLEKFYSQEGTRRMVKEIFELPKYEAICTVVCLLTIEIN